MGISRSGTLIWGRWLPSGVGRTPQMTLDGHIFESMFAFWEPGQCWLDKELPSPPKGAVSKGLFRHPGRSISSQTPAVRTSLSPASSSRGQGALWGPGFSCIYFMAPWSLVDVASASWWLFILSQTKEFHSDLF